ncbi:hypothetical protein BH10PLA1_BH10PLA1_16700 [soil metagenome]
MNLDYRARRDGKNRRTSWLPPKESDARGFIDMAIWIGTFVAVGLVVCAVFAIIKGQS